MKNVLIVLLTTLICIVATSCDTDESNMYGSIYGVVTVSNTAEPMRATGVELYKAETGALLLKTVTYDDGHFEFDDLLPGYYIIQITADGYEEEKFDVEVEAGRISRADMQLKKLDTYMTIITESVDAHSNGTAVFKGSYSYYYINYKPDEFGFIYGQNPNLSMSNGTIAKTDSKMTLEVTGLKKGTWYVKAYAKNNRGYAYGNVLKFEINGSPEVSTKEVSNITDNTATLNGLIDYAGDPEYTEKGFVYSCSFPNPTVDDPQSATTKVVVSGRSKEFSVNIANLSKDKTYYVRAYAKGNTETVYGTSVSFVATSSKPYIVIDNIAIQLEDLSKGTTWSAATDLCSQSRVGGFSDWRLPTIGELSLMYANRDKIKGFDNNLYWSSTRTSSSYYYALDFGTGNTWDRSYSNTYRVRAVRTYK